MVARRNVEWIESPALFLDITLAGLRHEPTTTFNHQMEVKRLNCLHFLRAAQLTAPSQTRGSMG